MQMLVSSRGSRLVLNTRYLVQSISECNSTWCNDYCSKKAQTRKFEAHCDKKECKCEFEQRYTPSQVHSKIQSTSGFSLIIQCYLVFQISPTSATTVFVKPNSSVQTNSVIPTALRAEKVENSKLPVMMPSYVTVNMN